MPNVIFRSFPLRRTSRIWKRATVLEGRVFPPNIAKFNRIDLLVKILMIDDGWRVAVRNECGSPKFEKVVNLFLGKFCLGKQKLRELETSP